MEEADVLADKIAVMAQGRLRCVGSSIHLKNRFAGYKLSVVTAKQHVTEIKDLVQKELEGSTVERETLIDTTCYLTFTLSPSVTKHLVPFLRKLEIAKDLIHDFSISQTTLEEVFLKVKALTFVF